MPDQRDKFGTYALVLLLVGALVRSLLITSLHRFYTVLMLDASYIRAGQDILRFNFQALGDRVPAYPFFVALCGLNRRAIWIAQSILGIAASLMVFDMAFRRTRNGLIAFLTGLACSLLPQVLIYESWVMTETLTNFLLVASLWLITRCEGAGESNIRYPLGLGLIVALAGLTRPLMICLAPVYYCFLIPLWPPANILKREAIKRTLSFALPVTVFILGWCGFNYFNSGYFTPTTRGGEHLMMQVAPYVDLAPDRFAVLRDAWIQSRQQNPPVPDDTSEDVYYSALPEVERRTGKTDIQVSHDFAFLALYLEVHHPLFCLRRAEQGWMQFWGGPRREEIEWPQDGNVGLTGFALPMAHFLMRQVKGAYLVLALLSIPFAFFRLKIFTRLEYLTFAMAFCISIVAAFTEFGSNRRYSVPLYMIIIYTLLTRVWLWTTAGSFQGAGATPD